MKKNFFIAIILLLSQLASAQNYTIDAPTIRMCRTAALDLSSTWQTIDFNGTCSANQNTFGIDPVSGNKIVYWDSTNKLFKFISDYNRSMTLSLFPATTTVGISVRAVLQYRIVVPNGVSPGVDYYFPYPEDQTNAYGEVGEVTIISTVVNHKPIILPIRVTQLIRTNGFKIQFRLSNGLVALGTCTLNSCNVSIQ